MWYIIVHFSFELPGGSKLGEFFKELRVIMLGDEGNASLNSAFGSHGGLDY